MKIALISCTKMKRSYQCAAHEMYSASELFKLSYQYAKTFADRIYILSAKYGLVGEDDIINPYDRTFSSVDKHENKLWANGVLYQLQKEVSLTQDDFYILAGRDYYQNIMPDLKVCSLPFGNLRYCERLEFLREKLGVKSEVDLSKASSISYHLHKYFNALPRYNAECIDDIPYNNGIYIYFEKGEKYFEMDRVVRVGSHNAAERLKGRLKNHYKPKKDGSIFRKNIGRAILASEKDLYITTWNRKFSNSSSKQYLHTRDVNKEKIIEDRITNYLKGKFDFVCIEVIDSKLRLRLEEGIIATFNQDENFYPSPKWFGKYSTEDEIKNSGMWLKEGLKSKPLSMEEFEFIIDGKLPKEVSKEIQL